MKERLAMLPKLFLSKSFNSISIITINFPSWFIILFLAGHPAKIQEKSTTMARDDNTDNEIVHWMEEKRASAVEVLSSEPDGQMVHSMTKGSVE